LGFSFPQWLLFFKKIPFLFKFFSFFFLHLKIFLVFSYHFASFERWSKLVKILFQVTSDNPKD
jgi:hypothetical protein